MTILDSKIAIISIHCGPKTNVGTTVSIINSKTPIVAFLAALFFII
jgi:hypothetical protein